MNYFPKFADVIDQSLAKQDRSASWLAGRLQVSPATISRWLNDQTRPGSPEIVARIADILLIEKAALLAAAGYSYQELPAIDPPAVEANQPQKSAETAAEQQNRGGIVFNGPTDVRGDVIQGSTVHKTHNAEGVVIQKEARENTQDEYTAGSNE